jgi:hypothetical protein
MPLRRSTLMDPFSRRRFLGTIPAIALIPASVPDIAGQSANATSLPPTFPRYDPALAREIVGASHSNLTRVKELVSARPALARAAWEWSLGDWETALGAASHVGNKEIAAVLLAAGAHPTIFSAAMLGQLDVVKGFVAAAPGIQRTRGPHGITLLDHARNGEATEVVKYLESLGDADQRYPNEPMGPGDPEALLGIYTFGAGPTERLEVTRNTRGILVLKREGEGQNNLFHHGGRVFNPSGAESVRIRFEPTIGPVRTVTVDDGPVKVTAVRQPQ